MDEVCCVGVEVIRITADVLSLDGQRERGGTFFYHFTFSGFPSILSSAILLLLNVLQAVYTLHEPIQSG